MSRKKSTDAVVPKMSQVKSFCTVENNADPVSKGNRHFDFMYFPDTPFVHLTL